MASDRESYRLFVACELPPAVREALGDIQRSLQRAGAPNLRWVRPEGIHLTLKFLGAVPAAQVAAIRSALAGAVTEPFRLDVTLSRLGSFGGPGRLRVVWVGLEGDVAALSELAQRVERALAPLGFPSEGRPFAPHLTLARVRDETPVEVRRRLHDLLRAFDFPSPSPVAIESVSLMRSVLGPGGAQYTCLARFPAA